MTIFRVRHITTYAYRQPVGFGEHRVLFRPRDSYDQQLLMADIAVSPTPSTLHWIHDVFGNCVAVVNFDQKATELRFETNIALEHAPANASNHLLGRRPNQAHEQRDRIPVPSGSQQIRQLADVILPGQAGLSRIVIGRLVQGQLAHLALQCQRCLQPQHRA